MYNGVPASSAQTAYRLFPPIGENALTPLRLLSPPDPLRWAPAGPRASKTGKQLLLFSSCCLWCGGDLGERTQLPLPAAPGAVSGEKQPGCLPGQGLAKRKARKGAQRQGDVHAPE